MAEQALLLVNLGSPASTEVADVRRYLNQFLMDPHVIDLPWPPRQDQRHQQPAQRPRQIDDMRIHQELIEVAPHVGHFSGSRRTQIDQQQRLLSHAIS